MAKDPAFLFYPGDYLRDTQCLSEKSQVAYDRIMCEHMRNICITQEQLNFFIKRLSEDEKNEVSMLLTKVKGGYQIHWVAESICKRRAYSESRRKNKEGKTKNISKSYDSHMENEIVNENESINKDAFGKSENLFDWEAVKKHWFNDFRWTEKFCRDKGIMMQELHEKMNEFISDTELREDFKDIKELKKHFVNTYKKNKNGSQFTSTSDKQRGAKQLITLIKKDFAAGRKEDA